MCWGQGILVCNNVAPTGNQRKTVKTKINLYIGRNRSTPINGGYMISKILVPSDGSKTSQKAAEYAIDLAKQLKASIIPILIVRS